MGIGERLKQERELKNMSLEDIQKKTKIQTRYLDAIEQERFHVMPGSFYVRAFIKEYANALQLDPDELMEEYSSDLPFENEEKSSYSRVQTSKKNRAFLKTPAVFSFLPSVIVVLLIIGIVLLVWLFRQGYFGEDEPSQQIPANNGDSSAGESVQLSPKQEDNPADAGEEGTDEAQQQEEDESEEQPDAEMKTTIQLDNYTNNDSDYTVSTNEEELILTIETENRNWLEIEDQDGESYYYSTFTQEENPLEVDISDFSELYLRFGEPYSITISINGESMPLSEDIQPTQIQEARLTIEKEE